MAAIPDPAVSFTRQTGRPVTRDGHPWSTPADNSPFGKTDALAAPKAVTTPYR
jgi:hypothetical protein